MLTEYHCWIVQRMTCWLIFLYATVEKLAEYHCWKVQRMTYWLVSIVEKLRGWRLDGILLLNKWEVDFLTWFYRWVAEKWLVNWILLLNSWNVYLSTVFWYEYINQLALGFFFTHTFNSFGEFCLLKW